MPENQTVSQSQFFSLVQTKIERSKAKAIAVVRLVDIERELFQYVFFNENRTTNVWLVWSDLGC